MLMRVHKPAAAAAGAGLKCLSSPALVSRLQSVRDAAGADRRVGAGTWLGWQHYSNHVQRDVGGWYGRWKLAATALLASESSEDEDEDEAAGASSSKFFQTQRVQERVQFLRELGLGEAQLAQLQSHSKSSVRCALLHNSVRKLTDVAAFLTQEVGLSQAEAATCLFESAYLGGSSVDASLRPKVQYFQHLGFSKEQLGRFIVGYPQVLGCQMERTILPMTRKLQQIGFKDEDIVKAYIKRPSLATLGMAGVNKMDGIVQFMHTFGLNVQVCMMKHPQVFTQSLEGKIFRTVDFFRDELELDDVQLRSVLKWPNVFSFSVEDNLRVKIEYLRSLGISKDGIARIVSVHPRVFCLNIETSMKPKVDFLLTVLRMTASDLVPFPQYLSYSLSKRIVPRYEYAVAAGSDFKHLAYYLACRDEEFITRCRNRALRLKSEGRKKAFERIEELQAM